MRTITVEDFKTGLLAIPGVVTLTIRARTVPDMNKTAKVPPTVPGGLWGKRENPYLGRVHKIVVANGQIGANYEASTNRALLRLGFEADFEAGERAWGTYVNASFVEHKGKDYIRFQERRRKESFYLDGRPIPRSVLAEFLPAGRDEVVKYRNFAVANILCLRWRGRTYTIGQPAPAVE